MWSFIQKKKKIEKLMHLVGFIVDALMCLINNASSWFYCRCINASN
jgi:hypothetical protein